MPEPERTDFQYDAFLSYSTKADKDTARKVEAFLESFHRNERAHDRSHIRPMHICRDGSDFKAKRPEEVGGGQEALWDIMRSELAKCRYLIVLCSPAAVKSTWMSKEISWFLEHRGRGWILPVVTAGHNPNVEPEECFPAELIAADVHNVRIWYDLRGLTEHRKEELPYDVKNPDEQLDRLACDLLPWDEAQYGPRPAPWRREQQKKQQRRKTLAIVAGILLLFGGILGLYWQTILRSRDLAEKAASQLEQKPDLSLLLAIKALDSASTSQAQQALIKAVFKNSSLFNPLHPINGHTDSIKAAVFSRDGTKVVTASRDKTARIWETATGKTLLELRHADPFTMVGWSRDGTHILTVGNFDGRLRVWDASNGRNIVELPRNKLDDRDFNHNAVLTRDGQHIITMDSKAIRIWDWRAGQIIQEIKGGRDTSKLSVSPDGRLIATVELETSVNIWDANTGTEVSKLGHNEKVESSSFSLDNKLIVTVDGNSTTRIWEVSSGRQALELKSHSDRSTHATFSPDGSRIVTFSTSSYRGGFAGLVPHIWDTRTGQQVALLEGHKEEGRISDVTFNHDGTRILTAGWDGTVRIWDASNGRQLLELQADDASFSPDEKRILTIRGKTARIWDATTGKELVKLGGLDGHTGVVKIAFSADGTRLATATQTIRDGSLFPQNGTVFIWDMRSAELLLELKGHTGAVRSVSFSPDGKKVATGGEDGTVRIWDATSGQAVLVLNETTEIQSVAFSPDGTQVITHGKGGARIWKAFGSESSMVLELKDEVDAAVFSPDGKAVATVGRDGVARIWDAKSGKRIQELHGHEKAVTSIVYSRDGARLLTASADGGARIWDAKTGLLQKELRYRNTSLQKAVLSPDARRVLTVSLGLSKDAFGRDEFVGHGGSVWIWDIESGQPLTRFDTPERTYGPFDATFSPDGKTLVKVDGWSPKVYICDVCGSIDELLAIAKQRAPRGLTPEEITQFGL